MSSLRRLPFPSSNPQLTGLQRVFGFRRLAASVPLGGVLVASLAVTGGAWWAPKVEAQAIGNNFGSVNVCASGMSTPAPCSSGLLVQITYGSKTGQPLAPLALTAGAPSPDFSIIGNTCTEAVPPAVGCLVHVVFSPKFAGLRAGAIVIPDSTGGVLATTLVFGVGVGPQVAFSPGVQSNIPLASQASLYGVAVDGAGNVFYSDVASNSVVEVPAGGGAQRTVISGLAHPSQLCVDGAGDLFIADANNNDVLEVPAGGGAPVHLGSGLASPNGVAVDGAGNVFIADYGNSRVVELPAGGGDQITIATDVAAFSLAVDAAGDLFIGVTSPNVGASGIVELLNGKQITVLSGLNAVYGLAVDSAGDLFLTGFGVFELPAGSELPASKDELTTVVSDVSFPIGLAMDETGDLFIGELTGGRLLDVQRSQPPALTFATTSVGNTSSDSPQAVQVQNIGNASLTAIAPGLSVSANWDQVSGDGTPEDCTAAFQLLPGALCNISISFEPTQTGSITGSVTLSDNALNANPAIQTIPLNGTGTKASQTISFNAIPAQTFGASVALEATASSGLTVSFASGTQNVCTVAGTTATMVAVGTCTITANQAGNSEFLQAPTVNVSFHVGQATPTITWTTPAPITYGTPLSATQLSATSTVAGTFAYSPAAGTVLKVGKQTLDVTFTPADTTDYATTQASTMLTVNQATPTITWATPAPITFGTPLGATQLNATSTVAGTFAYSPVAGAVPKVGSQTLSTTFTPTDATDYGTATANVMLTVSQGTPTITWATPAAITYGTLLSNSQLNATASAPGSFTYTPAAGTLLGGGVQTLKASFTPTDTTDYATTSASVMLTVNPAAQAITFTGLPATAVYGMGPFTLNAASSSSLPIAYSVSGPGSLSGSTLTITGAGTVAVTASQPGTANYAPATPVTLTVNVTPASSAITLTSSVITSTFGASVTLTATVTSPVGTPSGAVTFSDGGAVLGMSALNTNGTASFTTTALPVGAATLSASYAATASYAASTSAVVPLTVNPVASSTALSASGTSSVFGSSVTLTATVTSIAGAPSGSVTFSNSATLLGTGTLNPGGVAVLTTSALPLGSAALTASYAGSADFAPSTSTPIGFLVSPIPTATALVSSSATAAVGTTVIFTATVADSSGNIIPTGAVSFSDSGTVLGAPNVDGTGVATYSTTSLAVGTHAITASYAGDANHSTSTSAALLQTITSSGPSGTPSFTMSSSTVSLSITQGQTGTAVFTFTAVNGFNQPVTLTCSNLPKNTACAFAPASLTPTSAGATSTLTISTGVKAASAEQAPKRPGDPNSPQSLISFAGAGLGGLVLLLGFSDRRRLKRVCRLYSLLLALTLGAAAVSVSVGCGGGGGSPKTPPGLNQVNITATGTSNGQAISQTVALYLTITK